MQEGILSLMQMAKTVAALSRFRAVRQPFVSVCLHPTTGGVAASSALLGDVNVAEPNALIGFAGPRVIESTLRTTLPEGFQRSEFLLEHGMIDAIVPRTQMKADARPASRSPVGAQAVSELRPVLERLYALASRGRVLGLERMQAACDVLGNPERSFETVHVGGTNGKGTVSAFVASMAHASGKRVGLYTSPHLVRFAERIQIGGVPIDDARLVRLLTQAMDVGPDLTFFEVATLTALLAFREAQVDLAVLEVGLGGRFDATNVIPPPRVAAITRISFDHVAELGDTLAKIAYEKAGIIKAGSAVIVGKLHPDAVAVVEKRVEEVGARLVPLGSPEPIAGAPLAYPRIAMIGSNLAVAVSIGRELGSGAGGDGARRGVHELAWTERAAAPQRSGAHPARLRAQPRRRRRALARARSERGQRDRVAARRGARVRRDQRERTGSPCSSGWSRWRAIACSSRRPSARPSTRRRWPRSSKAKSRRTSPTR